MRKGFCVLLALVAQGASAQTFTLLGQSIGAFAGQSGTGGYTGDGGLATAATLNAPWGIAFDHFGNLYIADSSNNVIREITRNGYISTYAGNGTAGSSGDGGAATSAKLNHPHAVTFDSAGNLYIADTSNDVVRKVTPAGIISLYAGSYISGYSGDGGQATSARLSSPYGVVFDSSSNLYIGDKSNNVIREVTAAGIISTYAGNHTAGYSGDGGLATSAELSAPKGIGMDSSGNLYIADTSNNRIRKVATGGTISTFAGNGTGSDSGDGGNASSAGIFDPQNVTVDNAGNVYIGEPTRLRWVSPGDIIETVAGTGTSGSTGNGGPATSAEVGTITGVVLDPLGQLYIDDNAFNVIRQIKLNNQFPSIALGQASSAQTLQLVLDQATSIASIAIPSGFVDFSVGSVSGCTIDGSTVNAAGTICTFSVTFTPQYPGIRTAPLKITNGSGTITSFALSGVGSGGILGFIPGIIATIAGNGTAGYNGDGGQAAAAQLDAPNAIFIASDGSYYISDYINCRIRRIIPSGVISTVAGNGTCGYTGDGAAATSAEVDYPSGLAMDGAENLYIVDGSNAVRKVNPNGIITTFAGTGTAGFAGDGGLATAAQLSAVKSVAADSLGNIYIADGGNNRIRIVYPSGYIATFAGNGSASYSGDGGLATAAAINYPHGMVADGAGDIYIADRSNQRIRMVNPQGIISTVAGDGTAGYSGDGGSATSATLNYPRGLTIDAANNIFINDAQNDVIRMVDAAGIIQTVAGTGASGYSGDGGSAQVAQLYLYNSGSPSLVDLGIAVDGSGNIYIPDADNQRVRKVTVGQTTTLSFPATADVTTSSAQTVTGLNQGNAAIDFSNFVGSLGYTSEGGSCSTSVPLTSGETCTVGAAFSPISGTGTQTGTLSTVDNALSSPQVINLTGTASLQATTATVSASPSPGFYGANVTLTATVSPATGGTPTGTAIFKDGSTTLGSGTLNGSSVATLTISTFAIGNHTITAAYSGDSAFSSSTSSGITETIDQATPVITWNTPAAITYPTPLSSTQLNATSSVPGTFVYSPAAGAVLSAGAHSLGVTFTPTDTVDYTSATGSVTQQVSSASQTITFPNPGTQTYGVAPITLTATASSGLTVSYSVTSGPATVSGSTLTITGQGTVTVQATQEGNGNYTAAALVSDTFTVNPGTPAVSVSSSGTPANYGTSVTFTATLPASATGTVTFYNNGVSLGSGTLSSGSATLTINSLTGGTHSITAAYSGDSNYNSATSSAFTQTIAKVSVTIGVVSSLNPSIYGDSITLTATFTGVLATPTGTAALKDGASALGTLTLNGSGAAAYTSSALAAGSHSLSVIYNGDTNYQ